MYGLENLPEEGGYMMYSNHQGKYDALGIISSHEKPCTFVIDAERAKLPIVKEVADLVKERISEVVEARTVAECM